MTISPPSHQIRLAVQAALQEDVAQGDVTTELLVPEGAAARGTVVAESSMVVAGVAVVREVFHQIDASVRLRTHVEDGARARLGQTVVTLTGKARSLLMGERVALNFLQHLSGIATLTARFCDAVRSYGAVIVDTRKTIPGLRALQKWAVRLGGGRNHRFGLGDGVLIKDNHVSLVRASGLGIAEACRLARERAPHTQRVAVEARSPEEVRHALAGGADVILLDNMSPDVVRRCVDMIKGRALVEVSGGITLDNVVAMAAAGAKVISIGRLTHSAPAATLSMDLTPRPSSRRRPRR